MSSQHLATLSTRPSAAAGDALPPPNGASAQTAPRRSAALPVLAALVAALATACALAYLLRPPLAAAAQELGAGWDHVGLTETLALVLICVATCTASFSAAFLWWQMHRLLMLRHYLRTLQAQVSRSLARGAPLHGYGFSERGLPFAPDGQALEDNTEPLARRLATARATLILGDHGIGKTTILRECALHATRPQHLLSVALGHAPLPILISLPAYAHAVPTGVDLLHFAARQLTVSGSPTLGSRLPRAFARWHLLLLCDGLDEVPSAQLPQIVAELHALGDGHLPLMRVVVTCDLTRYTASLANLADLRAFDRVVAKGLSARELSLVLKRAARVHMLGDRKTADAAATLRESGLGAQCTHPSTLAAALALLASGESLPLGRARLLLRHVSHLLERTQPDATACQRTLDVLAQLAATMRHHDLSVLPVAASQSAADALITMLSEEPAADSLFASAPPAPAHDQAVDDETVSTAIASGILEWLPDGAALCFASHERESALAALWLIGHTANSAPQPLVYESAWWEPLIIWAAHLRQTTGSLSHLLALFETVIDISNPSRLGQTTPPRDEECDLYALMLAAALEAVVPGMTATSSSAETPMSDADGLALRTILDAVTSATADAGGRAAFADAFGRVERECQVDLTGHLAALAQTTTSERLVRAQAVTILATLPSPTAADGIAALLAERDPVLRLALDQAIPHASSEVYARLQDAISSENEYVRHRAADMLALGGPMTLRAATVNLASGDPRLRAASARALGVLRQAEAKDVLITGLDDQDATVRATSAWALGRLGQASAIDQLTAHLTSPDLELRAAVAGALGDLRAVSALADLRTLLSDADVQVRRAAATALGKIGDAAATRALRDHRADDHPLVQAAVTTALRRVTGA